ncbi:hypothetical protein JDV02_008868 [Purpureocillium takamizusanense]|uniref:Uncharacterized protein n=1 Tax=Purpureocillium takamizusanense TaxID=2060973 RepID=A0A9Q8QNT2_9HYPO|nr:uncharacterized protein JDV02_008868 [Purpureocillium takamizusanense]UNI23025.1 hypothetical protein JDV02_008868 [Purpureocillium takamizusanense]
MQRSESPSFGMDDLRGISGACSQPSRGTKPRRASSISLDPHVLGAVQPRHVASVSSMPPKRQSSSGPAKSPLLLMRPQELHFVDGKSPSSPGEGCPLLPTEPSPEPPSLSPLQGWMVNKSGRELRMLGLPDPPGMGGRACSSDGPQSVGAASEQGGASSGDSSWDVVEYDADTARQLASRPQQQQPGHAAASSQESAPARENRSEAPSPETQSPEAGHPSPVSSIELGDEAVPEHTARRLARLDEELQPIGGLGDSTLSLVRYHRHACPVPGVARLQVGGRAHDRRGRSRVKKQTRLRRRHK